MSGSNHLNPKFEIKIILISALVGVFSLFFTLPSSAEGGSERQLALRVGQARYYASVGVEAYLIGDKLEVTVYASRTYKRPKIISVILFGQALGKLKPSLEEARNPGAGEDLDISFPRMNFDDIVQFYQKGNDKVPGSLIARGFYEFRVPEEKILPGNTYEIRILLDYPEQPGETDYYTFPIKDFYQYFASEEVLI